MKLLTDEIKQKLPELGVTESIPLKERKAICKFFNPCGSGTWYVIEGSPKGDDFIFFGLVDFLEKEIGHFSLRELQSIKLPFGFIIERDILFEPRKVKNLEWGLKASFYFKNVL